MPGTSRRPAPPVPEMSKERLLALAKAVERGWEDRREEQLRRDLQKRKEEAAHALSPSVR